VLDDAIALHQKGRLAEAALLYKKILAHDPINADALHLLGVIESQRKNSEAALELMGRAVAIDHNNAASWSNRGVVLHDLKRFDDAVASYDRALSINRDYPEALYNRGLALDRLKRFDDAIASYERALAVRPNYPFLFGSWLLCRTTVCDWRGLSDAIKRLEQKIDARESASPPFPVLTMSSTAARQKTCTEIYVRKNYPATALLPPLEGRYEHDRIRLGYFSADFRNHATAYLAAGLFERHDRARFELTAFSFGSAKNDAMRTRLEKSFDRFIDVRHMSDADVAGLARKLEIDIAVDLKGFTRDSRTGIFALRAAPIQVNYLGYPGTMGAGYIDYLIADPILIPEGDRQHYAEKIAYLPDTYQPNDSTRPIAGKPFTRAECGLPDNGLVFCCFNRTYKILPFVFDVWMRLLRSTPGSVLWLVAGDATATQRLRAEAQARSVDPARLVFAERMAHSEHLARHRLADMFLDTLPYNAHTTASDALWAGVPVLTCLGQTFAGRVGASLLNAIGLPELVTRDLAQYEAMALELATNPDRLLSLKQTLAANRLTRPLFDTARFAAHIESAYVAMWKRHQAGLVPDHIYVRPEGERPPAAAVRRRTNSVLDEAVSLHQGGRLAEAALLYGKLLEQNPDDAEALHLLGVIELQGKNPQAALPLIERAIEINPKSAVYFSNRGAVLQDLRRSDDAIASYDRALEIKPNYADALYNRGLALQDVRRFADAVASYDRALAIKPDYAKAFTNRGHALHALKRFEDAIASYDRALTIDPEFSEALYGRGDALRKLKRYDDAIADYEKALAIKPDYPFLLGALSLCKLRICDWRGLDDGVVLLAEKIDAGQSASPPFAALTLPLSAGRLKSCAGIYTQHRHPESALLPPPDRYEHNKIRLGYFSADFHSHATSYLMAELFERHDRATFELIAFSFGHVKKDEMRTRLETSFDRFLEVGAMSDKDVARLARRLEIDIAVDLKGFTHDSRTGIFALRAAPVQVNYLGFPGTMGAGYIDYLIADSILIPENHQQDYAEKIAYLPDSYQANDSKRPIADRRFTRSECGLPERGFVFCCFNNSYKILPAVFDVWMRLLRKVDGSVLWLYGDEAAAMGRLKAEAQARGIDAARLVFAKWMPLSEHLARHRMADLFLDTLPCNAHTTTSDALWAGLPVLTCLGQTFAGRVAASLLNAVGLPELITQGLDRYEALALELAADRKKLLSLKQKLAANRLTQPLFDAARFTQHIELAYVSMWKRHQAGLPADHIYVQPAATSTR